MTSPLPTTLPVMSLRDTVLLPGSLLLIYVFQKPYRRLLADVLRGDRLFLLAQQQPANGGLKTSDLQGRVGTVALVRLSVMATDGTSTALLQGLERARIDTLEPHSFSPYQLAKLRLLPSLPAIDASQATALRRSIWELLAGLRLMAEEAFSDACHDSLAKRDLDELVNATIQEFCRDTRLQQKALETVDTTERAQQAISYLSQVLAKTPADPVKAQL